MELNAYDAIETFRNDFAGKKYYILQEGLSTLCEQMKNTIIKNGSKICLNEKVKEVKEEKKSDVVRIVGGNKGGIKKK